MSAHRFVSRGAGLAALATALLAAPGFAQEAPAEDEDVVIVAQRDNQSQVTRNGSLGALGNKDAMDTPFAIKSYNAALILNQQPQTLGQVLENDPAIRVTNGFGIAGELFVVRGFNLSSDDVAFNGLYGITPRQLVAPELYDQVQVLSGASAFLNGAAPGGSGLGGGINLISKRATAKPITRITANYTSDSHFGGAFDFGRRFGNGEFGIRINGALRGGDVSVDGEYRNAKVIGAAFDWTTDRLRVTVDLGYQRLFVRGLRHKVAISTAIPAAPRADVNYAQQWQFYEQRDIFGQIALEYEISDNAEFYASFGARDGMEDGISMNAVTLTNPTTGAATSTNAQRTARTDNNEAANAGIRVRGTGGGISHELNLGASMSWQISRSGYERYATYATNIYNPVQVAKPGLAVPAVAAGNLETPFPVTRLRYPSFYASDTLGFANDAVLLTLGLRHQIIEDRRYAYGPFGTPQPGAQTSRLKGGTTTPVVGLVVKPNENISLYANRIEGLVAGFAVADTADILNRGHVFPPFQTVQYELGGKVVVGGLNASIAAFQSERPNGFYRNLVPAQGIVTREYVIDGLQRNRGLEVALDGELTKGLRIISGAALNDAKIAQSDNANFVGKKAVGVPDYTVNANVEWDVVPSFTLTGRVMHTGPQMVNQLNTLELDSWTRFDVGGRFVTVLGGNPVTFRANVDNVLNKRYWASAFTSFPTFDASLLQGLPRTFKLSVTADF